MKASLFAITIVCAALALVTGPSVGFQSHRASANTSLPAWLIKAIAERKASRSRDDIEESTYQGRRVFEIISGNRADTGDEHILFSETGKKLCVFGGFVGHVTWGSCDIAKIIFVRTIFPDTPLHKDETQQWVTMEFRGGGLIILDGHATSAKTDFDCAVE